MCIHCILQNHSSLVSTKFENDLESISYSSTLNFLVKLSQILIIIFMSILLSSNFIKFNFKIRRIQIESLKFEKN